MNTCRANKCVTNTTLIYEGVSKYKRWNDFKKCGKKEYKDGFCKKCFEPDQRDPSAKSPTWIPDQVWRRNGIYGEPYDFPYQESKNAKDWVKMIHHLHPHLKPVEEDIVRDKNEIKLENVRIWLNENAEKINYKLGTELNEIIN